MQKNEQVRLNKKFACNDFFMQAGLFVNELVHFLYGGVTT